VAAAAPPAEREAARVKAGEGVDEQLVAPLKALLRVPAPLPAHADVKVAFVGEPWAQALKMVRSNILQKAKQQHDSLYDHTTGLLQATRVIAPDATYQFVGVETSVAGGLAEAELVRALGSIKASDAEVLVFGYGPANQQLLRILREIAGRMVVVIAAGNTADTSSFAPLDDVALIVGATDANGSLTKFSDSSPRSVSAPGADIPVVSPTTGNMSRFSGTSYSAALAGGAAALLKASRPSATPQQIINALRETAKQPARSIDLTGALRKLAEATASSAAKK
jgi:subtilisin family serine protease